MVLIIIMVLVLVVAVEFPWNVMPKEKVTSLESGGGVKTSLVLFRRKRKCYQALLVFEILYGEFDDVYTHKTHA